jgi:hypothetical protein
MIYCHKIEKCPLCDDISERRMGCNFCERNGNVISKSTYEPYCAVNPHTGQRDLTYMQKNPTFLELLKCYSLWPEPGEARSDFEKPMTDAPYTIQKEYDLSSKKHPLHSLTRKRKGEDLPQKKSKVLKSSDPVYFMLEEFLHQIVWKGKKWWDGLQVDKLQVAENKMTALVFVSGMGCTMCPYAMKDHGTNKIWFVISKKGFLTFHCHSQKEAYGCQTAKKIQLELPSDLIHRMFETDPAERPPSLHLLGASPEQMMGGGSSSSGRGRGRGRGRGQGSAESSGPQERFSFDSFVKRKRDCQGRNFNVEAHDEELRNLRLERLSRFYKLKNSE